MRTKSSERRRKRENLNHCTLRQLVAGFVHKISLVKEEKGGRERFTSLDKRDTNKKERGRRKIGNDEISGNGLFLFIFSICLRLQSYKVLSFFFVLKNGLRK